MTAHAMHVRGHILGLRRDVPEGPPSSLRLFVDVHEHPWARQSGKDVHTEAKFSWTYINMPGDAHGIDDDNSEHPPITSANRQSELEG